MLFIVFVPVQRATKASQLRTARFREFGAEILGSYDEKKTTHLLVRSRMSGSTVAKDLGVDVIPDQINVVYNSWPSECIESGRLLDLKDYKVPGVPRMNNRFRLSPSESRPRRNSSSGSRSPSPSTREGESDDLPAMKLSKESTDKDLLMEILEGNKQVARGESSGQGAQGSKSLDPQMVSTNSFLCVNQGKSRMGNDHPNKVVLDKFTEQLMYYESVKDNWKAKAYRQAINSLRKSRKPIRTAQEAMKLPGFGKSLADHLEEIIKTGRFRKLDAHENDIDANLLSSLLKIYGVGPMTAAKWIKEGVKGLEDVRKRPDLTEQQLVGLDHYDDFNTRIPRNEVTEHFNIVREELSEIDNAMDIYCMGSYRRGMPDCGDIDLIITKKNVVMQELCECLYELLEKLGERGFIKCTLSGKNGNDTRWLGASALSDKSPWRRMDILLVPWKILGSSLIYYTGDDIFNRSIRQLAKVKGYRLSNNGLFIEKTAPDGKKNYDTLIESSSEKKIFEILGVPYIKPEQRVIGSA